MVQLNTQLVINSLKQEQAIQVAGELAAICSITNLGSVLALYTPIRI